MGTRAAAQQTTAPPDIGESTSREIADIHLHRPPGRDGVGWR